MKSRVFSRPSVFTTSHMLLVATLLSASGSSLRAMATMPDKATFAQLNNHTR